MHHHRLTLLAALALTLSLYANPAAADPPPHVFWLGQNPSDTNFTNNAFTPDDQQAELLAGGDWLHTAGDWEPGDDRPFATYHINVPQAGTYNLWTRKFWKHGPFRWRFNDRDWQICPRDVALHSNTTLRMHLNANWVYLGQVQLEPGQHTFQLEVLPEKNNNASTAAFDAFLLTQGPFVPRGKLAPDQRDDNPDPGYFTWEPEPDPLNEHAPIDLRHLNESEAGQHGFVQRDGDQLALGDGTPVRFWAVQDGGLGNHANLYDRRARRLAKYGVNLVRMGQTDFFIDWMTGDHDAFRDRLDTYHAKVAALKDQGIYTYINHLYWHTSTPLHLPEDVLPGFDDGNNAIALLFFSEDFQDYYLEFLAEFMSTENPYTGLPMAEDPAVAFLEIQNESSLLFHTFNPDNFPDAERELVERKFGDWLIDKYGSLDAAAMAWGGARRSDHRTPDDFAAGRAGLYAASHLRDEPWARNQRNQARARDQLQFMVQSQRDFYDRMTRKLREQHSIQQLIVPSNWTTADERILGGLERYTYTAGDIVARNSYFDADFDPRPDRFHAVDTGDTFRSRSALKPPAQPGPLATPHIHGHPFIVTENSWTRPNRYRAEWPILVAAYASLAGIDGWTFFSADDAPWQYSMQVWDINNPTILGQFPAAALIYRRGDIAQPDSPAVRETIALDDAFSFQGTASFAAPSQDPLWRDRLDDFDAADDASAIDHRAFFVGPVVHEFTDDQPTSIQSVDLDRYIDTDAGVVRSMSDQLRWDYDTGILTIDSPAAQGAVGFLADVGPIELADISLESDNPYASIIAVALDDKPLAESERVLIQAATWDRPAGFETEPADGNPDYRTITALGHYPLNVRRIEATVSLANPEASSATVLDANGDRTDRSADADADAEADTLSVTLPEGAIYTVIE